MKRMICWVLVALMAISGCDAQKKQTTDYYLQKAIEVLKEGGDDEEALTLVEQQLELTPHDMDALLLKVRILRDQEKYSTALSALNKAVRSYKKKETDVPLSTLYWWRATVWTEMDENENAMTDINKAIGMAKKDAPVNLEDMYQDRAQLYYEMGDYDSSDRDYREMLRLDDGSVVPQIGLARNCMKREQYAAALDMLNRCERYNSEYVEVYHFRMKVYDKLGETDKAIKDAIRYYELDDEPDMDLLEALFVKHPQYAKAEVAFKERTNSDDPVWKLLHIKVDEWIGDYEAALEGYNDLETAYGKNSRLCMSRALAYEKTGDLENAIRDMTWAIEQTDTPVDMLYLFRAQFYRESGMYAEAIADYCSALYLNPIQSYAYYNRGWCKELSGDDDGAMEDYDKGIDLDPSYAYTFLMRGEQYLKRGDAEKAKDDFETILRLDTVPDDGSCRQYALAFLRKEAEAIEWMNQIIASDTASAGNYYDSACLYARLGHKDKAIEALTMALKKGYKLFAHIEHDDDMDPLRDMPEFIALIKEYNKPVERTESGVVGVEGKTDDGIITEVPMKKMYSGIYEVACTVNELPLKFVFDTGASTVSISSVEASFMYKNGYLKKEDVKGKSYFVDANGDISEGTVICLREIKVGDAVLRNVDASVAKGQNAPLLLGQSVLERFGIITIDNINSKLVIKQIR